MFCCIAAPTRAVSLCGITTGAGAGAIVGVKEELRSLNPDGGLFTALALERGGGKGGNAGA